MNGEKEKLVEGHEIIISSASRMNRVRDIGLLIVAGLVFCVMFFGWRETANREEVDKKLREQYESEFKTFKKMVDELRGEHNKSMTLKEEIIKELKSNRDLMLKAHKAHEERLTRAIQILERLEKKDKK